MMMSEDIMMIMNGNEQRVSLFAPCPSPSSPLLGHAVIATRRMLVKLTRMKKREFSFRTINVQWLIWRGESPNFNFWRSPWVYIYVTQFHSMDRIKSWS